VFSGRLSRIKSIQNKRKWLIFLLRVAMNQATSSIVATSIATTIKATNTIAMTVDLTNNIKTIDVRIVLILTMRTLRAASTTNKG
jgi:hypothetical protein